MKKMLAAFAAAVTVMLSAADAPVNKVNYKNWWPLRSKSAGEVVKVDAKTGVIEVVNIGKDAKGKWTCTGANQGINLNQKVPRAIRVGAECKAEKVSGKATNDFSVYMDVTYTDNTRLYGQCVQFTPGTHDWEKKERTFTFPKAVKNISFYIFLRNNSGKASFRNVYLYEL